MKIGFFQFTDNYGDPFGALSAGLSERESEVRDALIVLPEAFNCGSCYSHSIALCKTGWTEAKFNLDDSLEELSKLSRRSRAFFVAGLLDSRLRRNSAYVINGAEPELFGHKRSKDSTNSYQPCEEDCGEWVGWYEGAQLGVLICNDVESHDTSLARSLGSSRGSPQIVCIPSHMTTDSLLSGDPVSRSALSGRYVILSNSGSSGTKSFVANHAGRKFGKDAPAGSLFLASMEELNAAP